MYAYRFYDENKKASKYWRDIGTLDAYFEANMDLCQVNPEFNLYDPEWPLRTYQPQAPPAKFVFAEDGQPLRPGARLGHLARLHRLGQHASRAACSARTCASTASATIEQCILMPGVRVGRHARIRRAIIDRDVLIPRGALIGYNAEEDRRRHTVTDAGVVVVTTDDEPLIGPLSEEALRFEAEADRRGGGARRLSRGAKSDSAVETKDDSMKITRVHGREILDSRGNPTVEVDVTLEGGAFGPRGGAVGRVDRRARSARAARRRQDALRRQGRAQGGRATSTARSRQALVGRELDQRALDEAMIALDGTPTKSRLGANALLGVSMAAARAEAAAAAASRSTGTSATLYGERAVHAARADDEHPQRRRARRHAASTSRNSW